MEILNSRSNHAILKTIEVLLCDDHEIFRNGIKATLEGQEGVEIIEEAKDGEQCLECLKTHLPDVVLLDINMPVLDGIETLKIIKKEYPFIKVLALTQYNEKRFVKQMLKQGADGYVLKSTSRRELLIALNEVMKNRIYLASEAQDAVHGMVEEQPSNNLFPEFGKRECEVIKLLCDGLNTKEIAEELNISFHTVESHRSNVMKKVDVRNIAGLVKWAVSNGFD